MTDFENIKVSKISIVTAVYNGGKTLETLIKSVAVQKHSNFEFIIIDGGSSDNTVDIIKKYPDIVSYWMSERDQGIYDAWNKGIKIATGDWIMFIGADDVLLPNALMDYGAFISKLDDVNRIDFISSRLEMVDTEGNFLRVKGWKWEWPLFLKEVTIAHPGALHAKKLFAKYGIFNIDYKIVGDFELLIRAKESLATAFMDIKTVRMSEGGTSDSVSAIKEHFKAAVNTGGNSKISAFVNAINVYLKFKIKKGARKLGLNLYLKRA
jgi:glycosyltransferase involved in cell wall biosynthesis